MLKIAPPALLDHYLGISRLLAGQLDFRSAIKAVGVEVSHIVPHDHLDVCIMMVNGQSHTALAACDAVPGETGPGDIAGDDRRVGCLAVVLEEGADAVRRQVADAHRTGPGVRVPTSWPECTAATLCARASARSTLVPTHPSSTVSWNSSSQRSANSWSPGRGRPLASSTKSKPTAYGARETASCATPLMGHP